MLEYLRDPFPVTPGADASARAPGPSTILLLDLLAAVPALMVLLRALLDETFKLRRSWANVVMLLGAIWIAASTRWADDRFAATIDGANILAALSLLWATQQMVRSWRQLRVVAAFSFGLLLICSAHGVIDRLVELPARRENFQKNLPTMLKSMNIEPNTFEANRIEQKINSGEMLGFGASINTFAAVMVMGGIVAVGAIVQRLRDREEPTAAAAAIALLLGSVFVLRWTDSRTAFATPFLAGGLFVVYGLFGNRLNAHRRLVLIAVLAIIAGGTAFLIHHGMTTGTLFHDSLNFRWRYWLGGWGVWRERPLIGVGLDGFGLHYLAHRLPIASEEVKDPHNFIVRAFTELGLVGGVLTLLWIGRAVWEMTLPSKLPALPTDPPAPDPGMSDLAKLSLVAIAGMSLAMIAATDFSFIDWNTAIEALKRLLFLCVTVIGGSLIALRSMQRQEIDARPAPWIRAGLSIAVMIFLVHNLIDFSMFENSAMFFAALVAGTAWGVGMDEPARQSRARVAAEFALATLAWIGVGAIVAAPTIAAESDANDGEEALRQGHFLAAAQAFTSAADECPGNAEYGFSAAMALASAQPPVGGPIRPLLDRAIAANPMSPKYYRVRAEFELANRSPDVSAVRSDYEKALRIDPNSVDMRLEYADTLARLNLPAEAKQQYETALRYNDQLAPDEPKRLSERKLAEVRQKIAALKL